jgi:hypothetical protein
MYKNLPPLGRVGVGLNSPTNKPIFPFSSIDSPYILHRCSIVSMEYLWTYDGESSEVKR